MPMQNFLHFAGISTSQVPGVTEVQCASDEDRVTLNYAGMVAGTSELMYWIVLSDGSQPDKDVNLALLGSGRYLQLPAGGTEDKPIQLFIRRSFSSADWKFSLASVSISVLYVERIVFNVYDFQGELAMSHAVRINTLHLIQSSFTV